MLDLNELRSLGDQIVPPPLEYLRATARRRSHRTWAATAAASVATVCAVVTLGVVLTTDDVAGPRPIEPSGTEDPDVRPLTYADGRTIHYGGRVVEAERPVHELDLTDHGVVFRTDDGRIWFTNGSAAEEVGALGVPGQPSNDLEDRWVYLDLEDWIVSANLGPNVAWFEFGQPDEPEIVVYDTRGHDVLERTRIAVVDGGWAAPHSVDDRSAYWFLDPDPFADDSMPQMRLDLATGQHLAVTPDEYLADVGARPARTLLTSHAASGFDLYEITFGYEWDFEVRGGRVVPMGMQPLKVRDGLTGAKLTFDAPAGLSGGVRFSHWHDDDTIVLVSASKQRADLLECRFSTGACKVTLLDLPASIVVPELGQVGR